MKHLLVCSLIASASASSAAAETYDWSGGYIGAQIGGRWAKNFMEWDAPNGLSDSTHRPSGFAIGAYGGYNWQFGALVAGIDVGVIGNTVYEDVDDWQIGGNVHAKAKLSSSFNARMGYAFGHILPYVTAGYSYAKLANEYRLHYYGYYDPEQDSFSLSGWNVGIGTEVALTDKFIGRIEYRYVDLGSRPFGTVGGYEEFDYRQQTATMGIAYKF